LYSPGHNFAASELKAGIYSMSKFAVDAYTDSLALKFADALYNLMTAENPIGVPEFINDWVSAPYPTHKRDLKIVRSGLVWLNIESDKRFGTAFHTLEDSQQIAICGDIHHPPDARPEFRQAAALINRFRWLTLCGFYTTDAGHKDVGYIGNVALPSFPGATPEQLAYLGLK
jgi:hypothetical protein